MGNGFLKQATSEPRSQVHQRMESMKDYCHQNSIALHTEKADIGSELLSRLSDGGRVISLIGFDSKGGYLFQSNSLVGVDFSVNDKASTFLIALKDGRSITMIEASFPKPSSTTGNCMSSSFAGRVRDSAFQEDMMLELEGEVNMGFDMPYSDMDYDSSYALQY